MQFSSRILQRAENALRLGAVATDSNRILRAKSSFVATMIALIVFSTVVALTPGRTRMEYLVDGSALTASLIGILTLQVTKRLDMAFGLLVGLGMFDLSAYYFLHGNREGDLYFFILIPAAAIAFLGAKRSVIYLVITLVVALAIIAIDLWLPRIQHEWHVSPINPDGWMFHSPDKYRLRATEGITFFSVMLIIYCLLYSAAGALSDANQKVEALLLNVLPKSIAARLMQADQSARSGTIVDSFDEVSILFADIVGFTELSTRMKPGDLVLLLNNLFSQFDRITAYHSVEKIKTIGDAYMAVCGLPEPNPRHAERIANVALEMLDEVKRFNETSKHKIELRVGINSGPVVAGVIGRDKFIYDLWGDAVNTASRMESHGRAGTIQTTKATFDLLKSQFEFISTGKIDAKGKGPIATWQLVKRKG